VLEVGCGTGLLLFRIAPHCDRYLGIDPARRGLERIERRLAAAPIPGASVRVGVAHDLRATVDERFDVVVVNSVAQYFPDVEYLIDVVRAAMAALEPGGSLFLGDLRGLPLLPAFAASIELSRAADDATIDELRDRAARRVAGDAELVVDPALFDGIGAIVPEVGDARVRLKHGEADNELTRFRYDVVLTKAAATALPRVEVRHVALADRPLSAIGDELASEPDLLLVTAIPNARVAGDVQVARWLAGEPGAPSTVAGARRALGATSAGVHPDDLAGLDPRYDVDVMWSAAGPDRFDALLRRHDALVRPRHAAVEPRPLASYANKAASRVAANLGPELRAHLRATLPDHMVPTAFVMLDALPRTPNGKIDRNALPEPDRGRVEQVAATVAAESDLERRVAAVWQDILSLDVVGVETNLFDLGANSLMMVRASTRLGEALGRKVSLVEMFGYPTIRSLANHLGSEGPTTNVKQGTDRAQARREALQRRRKP
jgi:SAM-dependent methyltransferase/acyl carrier protein